MRVRTLLTMTLASILAATPGSASISPVFSSVAAEGVGVLWISEDERCAPHSASITFVSSDLSSGKLVVGAATHTCSGHIAYNLEECSRQGSALVCDRATPDLPGFVPILDAMFIMEDSGHLQFEAYWLADNGQDDRTTFLEGQVVPVYAGVP